MMPFGPLSVWVFSWNLSYILHDFAVPKNYAVFVYYFMRSWSLKNGIYVKSKRPCGRISKIFSSPVKKLV